MIGSLKKTTAVILGFLNYSKMVARLDLTRTTLDASTVQWEHGAQLLQAPVLTATMAECHFKGQREKRIALVST